jgi:hypothetical protein
VTRWPFIEAEEVGQRRVNRACAVTKVSRAADSEWRRQQPSRRAQEDRQRSEKVQASFEGSRRRYGAPRCIGGGVRRGGGARASEWPD